MEMYRPCFAKGFGFGGRAQQFRGQGAQGPFPQQGSHIEVWLGGLLLALFLRLVCFPSFGGTFLLAFFFSVSLLMGGLCFFFALLCLAPTLPPHEAPAVRCTERAISNLVSLHPGRRGRDRRRTLSCRHFDAHAHTHTQARANSSPAPTRAVHGRLSPLTLTHARTHTHAHAHTRTHTHTHTHTHRHRHIHTHTHTHTVPHR